MQAQYEENIAKCEIAYLEDTQNGNIVKGFDNYIKGTAARRRTNISDADRIFSLSSYSYAAKVRLFYSIRHLPPGEWLRLTVVENVASTARRRDPSD